jgi:hypothetical protein
VNRASLIVKHQVISSSNPTERAVYREASIGPEGATLVLALQLEPRSLLLPSSAHAAALEELARVVRNELVEQEQAALQCGAHESATPPTQKPTRHQGGAH